MTTKRREPRQPVQISVRLVTDAGWGDAQIRNVSSGGLMATSSHPPQRGSYVELRRDAYSIVGRVVWCSGDRFGIQAQGRISLPDLTSPHSRKARLTGERRRTQRDDMRYTPRRTGIQERADASARQSRAIEFVAISAIATSLAYLVADYAQETLATPLEVVRTSLGSRSG